MLLGTAVALCGPVAAQLPDGATRLVDVFGTPTRVLTLGLENRNSGDPVIFLQSGAGTALEGWGDWPVALSELAPVVGYDRPGLGESPFDGFDPSPQRVATHARELLDVLQIPPPYLLVGHSWGGPLILYFAAQYPDEVVGMVYLDPADPRISRSELLLTDDEAEMERRGAAYREAVAALQSSSSPPGRAAESRVRSEFNAKEPEDRSVPNDPSVPTAIVLATRIPNLAGGPYYIDEEWYQEYNRVRIGRFVDWSLGRPNITLMLATDAGHFVHLDARTLATEAVKRVLAAIEASR
ncbi:MAG: alpha/beta fold hydrolase [Gemmatimonadetes bacterium]|nr:alpha/beta fold hydrolase [Gemmatimonadota bacterium]